MTPPVFVLDSDDAAAAAPGCLVRLSGPEGRHAVTVRRMSVGEAIRLVDGTGTMIDGTVAAVLDKQTLDVAAVRVERQAAPVPLVTVVQALPKGERGELAVELLTEVGVDVIVPWAAANCVTHWRGERAEKSWRRWADAATAAAKQARRSRFPQVSALASTADVVERVTAASCAVVLHEDATTAIASIEVPTEGDLVVIVGPEGGLTPDEVAQLVAAGATSVRLGPSVLRTSSAGIAAVAAMLAGSARWSMAGQPPAGVEG